MILNEKIVSFIPVLKINNRHRNLEFYQETLGIKDLLEEGAFTSLGDKSKIEKLVLEETPGNRVRKVEGAKKLAQITIRVGEPKEIESLLARGAKYDQLYRGEKGYAFSATSPEGDHFLLHAEEQVEKLKVIEQTDFVEIDDFNGLTAFEITEVTLRVPDVVKAKQFYQDLDLPIAFVQGVGADLTQVNSLTWDLSAFYILLEQVPVAALCQHFEGRDFFVPKSEKFFVVTDESQIELRFEKA